MRVLELFRKENGKIYATIGIDEELNAVVDVWEGYFGSIENFNKVLLRMTEILEERHYPYWLADLRNLEGPFTASSAYIVNEIVPRLMKAGLKREAIVLPENLFAETSVKDTVQVLSNRNLRLFNNYQKARNWLKNGSA
jgi:hypothetical protein